MTDSADPSMLQEMHFSFVPSSVLRTACELDVFTAIAEGATTAPAVADACEASERGIRMLLDTLVPLGLLEKQDEGYALTPPADRFLVAGRPDSALPLFANSQLYEHWGQLAESVRTGQPVIRVEERERAQEFFPHLVRGLHVLNREPSRRLVEALSIGEAPGTRRVLDVACGSGVWGIAVCEADSEARVTFHDFPGMLPVTREFIERHEVGDQVEFLEGDLKEVDFGTDAYDLAILGNIVHSEGEASTRDLFERLHRALRDEGRIAIIDMIPNETRTGPLFPVAFALNMLLHTREGDTYTFAQYEAWLEEAGFSDVRAAAIGSHSPAIIATRS